MGGVSVETVAVDDDDDDDVCGTASIRGDVTRTRTRGGRVADFNTDVCD